MTTKSNADRGATSPARITQRTRAAAALKLRATGVSFAEIAAQLGYSSENAANKAVLTALRREVHEEATQLRTLEGLRLDDLHAAAWDKAMTGDPAAIGCVLRIMERRARLFGLDAPQRVDLGRKDIDLDGAVDHLLNLAMSSSSSDDDPDEGGS
jgi:hypothetical protein